MIINKNIDCIGCGVCEIICPQNTLKIKMSSDGFYQSYQVKEIALNVLYVKRVCPVWLNNSINPYLFIQHTQIT